MRLSVVRHALLCYTPTNAGLMSPAAGLTFAWNNLEGVNNLGITVESFSDDALKRQQIAEMIQVKMSYDMKVVGADLGDLFITLVAVSIYLVGAVVMAPAILPERKVVPDDPTRTDAITTRPSSLC